MRSKLFTVIFFILLSLLLIGCNGNTPQAPSQNGDTPPATEEAKGLCISKDGELLSVIILPENATEDEKSIASRLSGAIFQRTHKQISVIEDKDLAEAPEGAIIVGRTSLSESTDAYSSLAKRAATVKLADGRLVVAFTGYLSGSQAANELIAVTGMRLTSIKTVMSNATVLFILIFPP